MLLESIARFRQVVADYAVADAMFLTTLSFHAQMLTSRGAGPVCS